MSFGCASKFGGQVARGALHLLLAAAQIARSPIQLAQAVEDGAFDAVLGVAVKRHVLGAVVFGHGIEQPHDAGVDQVVQIHVNRQVFVHTNGDRLYQRKVIEHDLVALFLRFVWVGGVWTHW